jgi:hypothetical protein
MAIRAIPCVAGSSALTCPPTPPATARCSPGACSNGSGETHTSRQPRPLFDCSTGPASPRRTGPARRDPRMPLGGKGRVYFSSPDRQSYSHRRSDPAVRTTLFISSLPRPGVRRALSGSDPLPQLSLARERGRGGKGRERSTGKLAPGGTRRQFDPGRAGQLCQKRPPGD